MPVVISRLLVYEHFSSGAASVPSSRTGPAGSNAELDELMAEGCLMKRAMLAGLTRNRDEGARDDSGAGSADAMNDAPAMRWRVWSVRGSGVPHVQAPAGLAGFDDVVIDDSVAEEDDDLFALRQLIGAATGAAALASDGPAGVCWIVAPERGAVLGRLVREARRAGWHVLAPDEATLGVCTSKRRTHERLRAVGVPVPESCGLTDCLPAGVPDGTLAAHPAWLDGPCVTKPDDGVGALGVVQWPSGRHALRGPAMSRQPSTTIERWIDGAPMSACLWFDDDRCIWLGMNRQIIDRRRTIEPSLVDGGACRLVFVRTEPTDAGTTARLEPAVRDWLGPLRRALPGLRGPIGIDFIDAPGGPVLIEINPRMTTSFAHVGPARWGQTVQGALVRARRAMGGPAST